MTEAKKTASPSDAVSRHDRLVEAYGKLKGLLTEFGYELRADDFEGKVDLDIHGARGDHLFNLDTIERVL